MRIRRYDFSFHSTLIRHHRLLCRWRKSVEFAAQEPGPGKNRLEFRKRVSIAVGCGGEHHQREVSVIAPVLQSLVDKQVIAGAVTLVVDKESTLALPEPLPKGHPLWSRNVIITPHSAGQSTAVERRRHELFRENLRRFVAGEILLNVVDKKVGY
jgi:hypothetical protein